MPQPRGDRDTYGAPQIVTSGDRNSQLQPQEPALTDGFLIQQAEAHRRWGAVFDVRRGYCACCNLPSD